MGKISRVVICGAKGTGKTSILEQLIYRNVTRDTVFHPTIEDVYVAHIETDRGTREKVRFYDAAGLDGKSKEIPRHYLSFADGYVLVYSVNNQDTFAVLDGIKKDIDKNRDKKEVTILVLGNKLDLDDERKVDNHQAQTWAMREKVKLYEVSVRDRQTLVEPFIYLTSKMNPPPNKSTFSQLGMGRKAKE